ncbi:MAG: MBG domain-containing protein, partial [Chitinophagaceae bacterium]
PLIIKAADTTEIYGSVNKSVFGIAYEGLKNGETLATSDITGTAPTASVQISGTPKVGTYTITISPGNQTSKNYSITYSNGTLTVAKANLLVTADNKSRTYGAVNPTLTYVMSGFVNNENLSNSGVTGTPDVTTFATQNSPVGNYDILPSLGTLFAFNYTFKYVNGTLAINKATLTVTADTSSRVYGAPDPVFTAKFTGYVLSQTAATSGVTGAPGFSTNATVTSPVGAYSVTPNVGSLLSDNYTFSYVSAAFNIRKASLIAKADTVQRFYGGANPTLTVTYIGFANGETLATSGITGTPTVSTSATSSSIVGTYQVSIVAGTQASGNYAISYVNGALRVNKAILSVTAQDKSRAYGEANP